MSTVFGSAGSITKRPSALAFSAFSTSRLKYFLPTTSLASALPSAASNSTCVPDWSRLRRARSGSPIGSLCPTFRPSACSTNPRTLPRSAGKPSRSAITQPSSLRCSVSVAFGSTMRIEATSETFRSFSRGWPSVPAFAGERERSFW